ncbi:hypothetical protein [Kordia sp.]|uniref:hypothetical protein n=1 Tax=Kordia sp. TaxID=1965332 RepID=UPI003D6BFF7F
MKKKDFTSLKLNKKVIAKHVYYTINGGLIDKNISKKMKAQGKPCIPSNGAH